MQPVVLQWSGNYPHVHGCCEVASQHVASYLQTIVGQVAELRFCTLKPVLLSQVNSYVVRQVDVICATTW